MVEAIVTFVKTARKNENLGHEDVYVETTVYRIEFEYPDQFDIWLDEASKFHGINVEQLRAPYEEG